MNNKVVFLHIEKAAGSTVHDIMYANFFPYYVASPIRYKEGGDNQKNYLANEKLNKIFKMTPMLKAAGGHSLRCYDREGVENVQYFTFLREPKSRYLSHYFYQNEVMGVSRDFEDFINDPVFNNFMCRKICGAESSEEAIKIIENKNILPCLVEHFDESLMRLKMFLEENGVSDNFVPGYKISNSRSTRVGGGSSELNDLMKKYAVEIEYNNKEDMVLYAYVKEKFFSSSFKHEKLDIKRGYELRVKIGKLVRRVFFVNLEKKVGFNAV